MALSDRWSRSALRTAVRRELLDTGTRWWTDAELNTYLNSWQDALQTKFEFVRGTATAAVGSSTTTVTLTNVATDILRVDAVYWYGSNGYQRLAYRAKADLDMLRRDWRSAAPATPVVTYQDDINTISFWPEPVASSTALFEYPTIVSLSSDAGTMAVPAWTKYSAINYCAWKAYNRVGPNHDPKKALRYKAKWQRQLQRFEQMRDAFFPKHAPSMVPEQPSSNYEADILFPYRNTLW